MPMPQMVASTIGYQNAGAAKVLDAGQEGGAKRGEEQEREFQHGNARGVPCYRIDIVAGQHVQQLEHLDPFVDAVQDAEDGQRAQAMPQARIRAAIGFQRNGQAHREKREAIDEEDQHHVVLHVHQRSPLCTVVNLIVAQQQGGAKCYLSPFRACRMF